MTLQAKKTVAVRAERGPVVRPVHIQGIEIRGVRGLESVTVEVPAPPSRQDGQWMVVLGENGAGKTTFLRSIAMASMPWHASRSTRALYRTALGATGGRAGDTAVGLRLRGTGRSRRGPTRWIDLAALGDQDDAWPDLDLYAFGSLRGTGSGGSDRDLLLEQSWGHETLFRPDARLIHAEDWLRREAGRAEAGGEPRRFFRAVCATLASLLPGGESIGIEGDEISILSPKGRRLPWAAMSDGYRSTLGWTIELIARWAHRHRDAAPERARDGVRVDEHFAENMACLVLVDQLDLHLHPRWQLEIIPRVRAAFPRTTFVVTTHNPLTIQGAQPGEVFVMRRDDADRVEIVQRDVPPGLDASRLLTGDWFGLTSTLDRDTLDQLAKHRDLLRARRPANDPARRRIEAALRSRLNGFADTSIERLAHSVAVEILYRGRASPRTITEADRARLRDEVERRLAACDQPVWARDARPPRAPPAARAAKPTSSRATSGASKAPAARRTAHVARGGSHRGGSHRSGSHRGASPLCGSPLCGSPLCGSPLCGSPLCGSPLGTLCAARTQLTEHAALLCARIADPAITGLAHVCAWRDLAGLGASTRPLARCVRDVAEAALGLSWARIVAVANVP